MTKCLDVGCGHRKHEGCLGIDQFAYEGVDIVCDLNVLPWPFEDSSFDVVYAHSILEHLDNFLSVMDEIHRICKPGARVHILVPYYRYVNAYSPVHRTFFTEYTFKFLTEELLSEIHDMTQAKFKMLKNDYVIAVKHNYVVTIRVPGRLLARLLRIMDSAVGGIISDLEVELEVEK
jgi:predicted SAM-dependent methyltransferase